MKNVTDKVFEGVEWLACCAVLLMLVLMLATIILRSVFQIAFISLQEGAIYAYGIAMMFGMALLVYRNGHIRLDSWYGRQSQTIQRMVESVGIITCTVPFAALLTYGAWDYVARSFMDMEGSREAAGLRGIYLLKAIIPFCGILIAIGAVQFLYRFVRRNGR